ncbi:MAG: hypothetical protein V4654_07930 [Bdellovibrionota bacterium]
MEQCDYPVPCIYSLQENTLVLRYLIRLFYVEHVQKLAKLLIFTLLVVNICACNKRDANPQNKDVVYAQLNKDLGEAKAAHTYVSDYIATNKADLKAAVPQSGEQAVYVKRINEGLNAHTYAAQQVRMYEVRAEERKLYVQRRYLESLTANGRKWPEEGEADAELLKLQMLREKVARVKNNLPKVDDKNVPRGTADNAASAPQTKPGSK